MKERPVEVIRGSENIYHDLKKVNADIEQLKTILAAEIITAFDREGLTVRKAQSRTGIAAADFSRIRNADIAQFTAGRLMAIINRLGSGIEVSVKVRRAEANRHATVSR